MTLVAMQVPVLYSLILYNAVSKLNMFEAGALYPPVCYYITNIATKIKFY